MRRYAYVYVERVRERKRERKRERERERKRERERDKVARLSSDAYVEYLRAYAARFALDVRCGVEASKTISGHGCCANSRMVKAILQAASHYVWRVLLSRFYAVVA